MSILFNILPQKGLPCHVSQMVLAVTKAAVCESVTQLRKGKRTSNFFENQLQFTPTKLAQGPPRSSISIWQTFNHLVKWPIFGQTAGPSGTLPICPELSDLQTCALFKGEVSVGRGKPLGAPAECPPWAACSWALFPLGPQPPLRARTLLRFPRWKPELREVEQLPRGHTAGKWKSSDSQLVPASPKPVHFLLFLAEMSSPKRARLFKDQISSPFAPFSFLVSSPLSSTRVPIWRSAFGVEIHASIDYFNIYPCILTHS